MSEPNGSRTHEPNLREVTAQLDDLKDLLDARFDSVCAVAAERDRLYSERATAAQQAVTAALAAQDKLTSTAFAAASAASTEASRTSQKAIDKSEAAQTAYNERSNEFRGSLDDAQKNMISRQEASAEFLRMVERIDNARTELHIFRDATVKDIHALRELSRESHGFSAGMAAAFAALVAIVGIAGVLIGAWAPTTLPRGPAMAVERSR